MGCTEFDDICRFLVYGAKLCGALLVRLGILGQHGLRELHTDPPLVLAHGSGKHIPRVHPGRYRRETGPPDRALRTAGGAV